MDKTTPISNTQIEPIKIEKHACPLCERIGRIVTIALSSVAFSFATAVALGIALNASLFTLGPVGILAGIVLSVALIHFVGDPSPEFKYRIQTIEQIESQLKTQNKETLLPLIKRVKLLFEREAVHLGQAYENHQLHNDITLLIDGSGDELKKVWHTFLQHLHGFVVYYPDGKKITLDFSTEMLRLSGERIELSEPELLDLNSDEDLNQLVALQSECFGTIGTFQKRELREYLSRQLSGCIIVRIKGRREIAGFLWYFKTDDVSSTLCIAGVGRKPGVCQLKMGEKLFDQFFSNISVYNSDVMLHVRESNCAAIALYKKFGFEIDPLEEGTYDYPRERSLTMKLSWDQLEQNRPQLIQKAS